MSDSATTYTEYQNDLKVEQAAMSKEDVLSLMSQKNEYVQDLDNLPVVKHNWVKRGVKVSCEGANHPHHSHFLVRK